MVTEHILAENDSSAVNTIPDGLINNADYLRKSQARYLSSPGITLLDQFNGNH